MSINCNKHNLQFFFYCLQYKLFSDYELQDDHSDSEYYNTTDDDQCSSDKEFIPDSEHEGESSDDSVVPIPTLSKIGPAHSEAATPDVTLKLANNQDVSTTEDLLPSVAETSNSTTSI